MPSLVSTNSTNDIVTGFYRNKNSRPDGMHAAYMVKMTSALERDLGGAMSANADFDIITAADCEPLPTNITAVCSSNGDRQAFIGPCNGREDLPTRNQILATLANIPHKPFASNLTNCLIEPTTANFWTSTTMLTFYAAAGSTGLLFCVCALYCYRRGRSFDESDFAQEVAQTTPTPVVSTSSRFNIFSRCFKKSGEKTQSQEEDLNERLLAPTGP